VRPENLARLESELPPQQWGYTRIGVLREAAGAAVMREGAVIEFSHSGYQHFV
jgi:thiamine monophosphate kinase